jgi:hypothetical protein
MLSPLGKRNHKNFGVTDTATYNATYKKLCPGCDAR